MKSISSILVMSSLAFLAIACEKEDKDAISMNQVNIGAEIDSISGLEYVDLGLPSGNLWATCNMGSTSPEQTGNLYSWGETQVKESYEWATYKWANGDNLSITKYCVKSMYAADENNYDKKNELDLSDDAANINIGERWFVPVTTDFQELLTTRNCTAKWCKLNGVGGFLFTSVRKGHEGNTIFIPLAGMLDGKSTRFAGSYGWYWCNSLYYNGEKQTTSTTDGSVLCLEHTDLDNKTIQSRPRSVGLPIRPVYRKSN